MTQSTQSTSPKLSAKHALIIGCNGTFGGAVGRELQKQGWQVSGLIRAKSIAPSWLHKENIIIGDCTSLSDVQAAAKNVDVMVYGANPLYHQWAEKALQMLEPTALVAQTKQLHLLFPGNVYNFDPKLTPVIDEESPPNPVSEKGLIRNAMEQRLKLACDNGARVTVVRAGDFICKNADSSAISQLLSQRKNSWVLNNPSPKHHCHSYAWIPDLAANAVALLGVEQTGFNVYNEQGIRASHQDWLNALAANNLKVKSKNLPWWALKVMGIFHPIIKEVIKMRYLWQQSLLLDGRKMQRVLGDKYRCTPLNEVAKAMT